MILWLRQHGTSTSLWCNHDIILHWGVFTLRWDITMVLTTIANVSGSQGHANTSRRRKISTILFGSQWVKLNISDNALESIACGIVDIFAGRNCLHIYFREIKTNGFSTISIITEETVWFRLNKMSVINYQSQRMGSNDWYFRCIYMSVTDVTRPASNIITNCSNHLTPWTPGKVGMDHSGPLY